MEDVSDSRVCCLDQESGLYHLWHFKSVLSQELARLDRWERPLSLALLEAPGLSGAAWAVLGRVLQNSLRCIDLAARLSRDRAAVIMPDADEQRGRRWLIELTAELERENLAPVFGVALARPWEGRTVDELMALAAENLGRDPLESLDEPDIFSCPGTAIAAEERRLLFAGFQELGAAPKH